MYRIFEFIYILGNRGLTKDMQTLQIIFFLHFSMETQHFMNAPGKVLAEPLNFYVAISQITTYEIVEDFHHFTYAVKMDTMSRVGYC